MALPVLLFGVLLVDPEFSPAPLGVEAPLAGALGLVLPEAPASEPLAAPLVPLAAPVPAPVPVPAPELPALPGVSVEEGGVVLPTELDVPVELAPSLLLPLPMVDEPGEPVPAPGEAGADDEPLLVGTLSSALRLQAVTAVAAATMRGMASQRRAVVQRDGAKVRLRADCDRDSKFMGFPW